MRVPVHVRDVYGRPLRYLLNEQQAQAWRVMTGRKTLTDKDVQYLEAFGCSVEEGDQG